MTMPEPPYYAVIFTNQHAESDLFGYGDMAADMVALAKSQPGYLGIHSTRGPDGFGITVSYWESEESIAAWKADIDHLAAQQNGIERWYSHYETRVARVERQYAGPEGRGDG